MVNFFLTLYLSQKGCFRITLIFSTEIVTFNFVLEYLIITRILLINVKYFCICYFHNDFYHQNYSKLKTTSNYDNIIIFFCYKYILSGYDYHYSYDFQSNYSIIILFYIIKKKQLMFNANYFQNLENYIIIIFQIVSKVGTGTALSEIICHPL